MFFKSMPSRDNPRIKIVFGSSEEYFAVTGAIRDIFTKEDDWSGKFASDLLAKIETDYDAEDRGEGGKPSVILEDSVVEQALPLLFVSASKLTAGASETELKTLKSTNAQLVQQVNEYEEKVKKAGALAQENAALSAERDKLSASNDALMKKAGDLSDQAESLGTTLAATRQALSSTQAELATARADLENLMKDKDDASQSPDKQGQNEELESLKKDLAAEKAKREASESRVRTLGAQIVAMRDRANASAATPQSPERMRELEANVTAGLDQIKKLKEANEALQKEKDAADKALAATKQACQEELEKKDGEISRHIITIRDLRAENENLSETKKNMKDVVMIVNGYKTQIKDLQDQLYIMAADKAKTAQVIRQHEETNATQQAQIESLKKENDGLQLTVSDLTGEIKARNEADKKKHGLGRLIL